MCLPIQANGFVLESRMRWWFSEDSFIKSEKIVQGLGDKYLADAVYDAVVGTEIGIENLGVADFDFVGIDFEEYSFAIHGFYVVFFNNPYRQHTDQYGCSNYTIHMETL